MRTAEALNPFRISEGEPIFAGENVIVGPNVIFVQLDDLEHAQLDRLKPAGSASVSIEAM